MVRLFHVYYPVRTVVLLACEALIIGGSFLVATLLVLGPDSFLVLNYERGLEKIFAITILALLCSYYFDLYAPQRLPSRSEVYFRLFVVLGVLSFLLAAIAYVFPGFKVGEYVLLCGLAILTITLVLWRSAYNWVIGRSMFCERVYVLGAGERANRIVDAIRSRNDLGMDVVGWAGATGDTGLVRDDFAVAVASCCKKGHVDRIIVALADRRGTMPVRELLDARLRGTKIEEATTLLEKISGKIEVEGLHPSTLIFSEGFRTKQSLLLARRIFSIAIAGTGLILCLPVLPIIALAVKISSPGPVLFRQQRVGRRGKFFMLMKFRTMRQDAEKKTGAVWATKDDPRVTKVGRFLRKTRLDEIPQLWNVLRGDMGFVGPRPERPEFVQWLSEQIPYYNLRHIIRPGITGWAQVRYQYGASLEETKQKVAYDLYYIKHMSVALDLLIMFETVKTVLLRRGAQ